MNLICVKRLRERAKSLHRFGIMDAKSFAACFDSFDHGDIATHTIRISTRKMSSLLYNVHTRSQFSEDEKQQHHFIFSMGLWTCDACTCVWRLFFLSPFHSNITLLVLSNRLSWSLSFNALNPNEKHNSSSSSSKQQPRQRICTSFITHIHNRYFVLIQHRHSNESQSIIVVYLNDTEKSLEIRAFHDLSSTALLQLDKIERVSVTHGKKSVQFIFTYSPNTSTNITHLVFHLPVSRWKALIRKSETLIQISPAEERKQKLIALIACDEQHTSMLFTKRGRIRAKSNRQYGTFDATTLRIWMKHFAA